MTEQEEKLTALVMRGVKIAKDLQAEGMDLNQALTIIFSAAGAAVACSENPMPLDQLLGAAKLCFGFGARSQGVEL